jgi:hypothetical protein
MGGGSGCGLDRRYRFRIETIEGSGEGRSDADHRVAGIDVQDPEVVLPVVVDAGGQVRSRLWREFAGGVAPECVARPAVGAAAPRSGRFRPAAVIQAQMNTEMNQGNSRRAGTGVTNPPPFHTDMATMICGSPVEADRGTGRGEGTGSPPNQDRTQDGRSE